MHSARLLTAGLLIGFAGVSAQDTNAAANVTPTPPPISPHKSNSEYYLKHTFGLSSHIGSFAGAGWNQLRTSPDEWGGGIDGFGKRLGSAYARGFIKNTVDFGVASLRGEVMQYSRCDCDGWPRLGHAVKYTFLRKTDDGGTTLAVGRLAGAFGSGFAANLWYPDSRNGVDYALRRSAVSLGLDAGKNVFKEFWPDIKRKFRRR